MNRLWVIFFCGMLGSIGCSGNRAQSRYLFADKLWSSGSHEAALSEWAKVIALDHTGKLAQLALYRIGKVQFLELKDYSQAVQSLRQFIQMAHQNPVIGLAEGRDHFMWDAQLQLGEILYVHLADYAQAILHYQTLVHLYPQAEETPEFLLRMGKSYFFTWQFEASLSSFQELIQRYPHSPWEARALYEIGLVYLYRDSQKYCHQATQAFQRLIKVHPASQWVPEAQFGIANCLEEMNQLKEALEAYAQIEKSYTAPGVISIKKTRIQERQFQQERYQNPEYGKKKEQEIK